MCRLIRSTRAVIFRSNSAASFEHNRVLAAALADVRNPRQLFIPIGDIKIIP